MSAQLTKLGVLRFILPSISDLVFILLFLAVLVGSLSNRPLGDADIGWHIRNGQQILDTKSIPQTDSFSSSMQGKPWFAWEWLYDVFVGGLEREVGLNGVMWLCALIIAATFAGVFRDTMRAGTNLLVALLLLLLAISASTIHLFARPHIVSWLLVWLYFVLLDRWNNGVEAKLTIFWLPVLMIVWVNLHGGFLLGIALLCCFWIGTYVEIFRLSDDRARVLARRRAQTLGIVLLLSVGATLANPYGYRLHEHIYRYLTNRFLMSQINEFASPDFHGAAQKCFAAIIVIVVIVLSRGKRRLRIGPLLVLLLAIYAGLYASRNLPIASILVVLVIGPQLSAVLSDAWHEVARSRQLQGSFGARMAALDTQMRGHLWPIVIVLTALASCFTGGAVGKHIIVHGEFDSSRFPIEAVKTIVQSGSKEPVLCPDSWGGFLIYRLSPDVKVVVDDRHDFYGEAFIRKYLTLVRIEPGWSEVLSGWRVRRVLMPARSSLAGILRSDPEWHVVHEDRTSVLFDRVAEPSQ